MQVVHWKFGFLNPKCRLARTFRPGGFLMNNIVVCKSGHPEVKERPDLKLSILQFGKVDDATVIMDREDPGT